MLMIRGKSSIARKVLIYLHASLLVQELVSFPFAYTTSVALCRATGFLQAYSGFCNVVAMWIITVYSVNYVHHMFVTVDRFIYRTKEIFCFILPLLTVFPLIESDYGKQNDAWCDLTNLHSRGSTSLALGIMFYFFWIWLFLIATMILLVYAGVDAVRTSGWANAKSFLTNTGAYGLISLITWIPHTIRRLAKNLSEQQDLGLLIPVYVTGIVYGLLYVWKPTLALLPDKSHVRDSTVELRISDLDSISSNPMGFSFGIKEQEERDSSAANDEGGL
jgi:hypothetical protein